MKSTSVRWTRMQNYPNVYLSDSGGTGEPNDEGDGEPGGSGAADEQKQQEPDKESLDGMSEEDLRRKLKNKTEEQDRQYGKLKEALARLDELQKEKDERDRAGKSELENAKADLQRAEQRAEKLADTIRRLSIQNAFLGLDDIKWHNAERALALVDLSQVEFDEDSGAIKDMKSVRDAARALAKSDPYLVKTSTEPPKNTPTGKPTGRPPATSTGSKGMSDEELMRKYNVRR
jgi:hypothetical protein